MFSPFAVFGDALYVGAYHPATGCEVWRTIDGASWDIVVGPKAATASGFGNPHNEQITALLATSHWLYAGVWNTTDGAALWRSQDGLTWTALVGGSSAIPAGFGKPDTGIIALTQFGETLLAGTGSRMRNNAELWVSRDGGISWEALAGERAALRLALGRDSGYLQDFAIFGDAVYVAVGNPEQGSEIWRSSDARQWEAVVGSPSANAAGLANPHWDMIFDLEIFRGALYAAVTSSEHDAPGALWRSTDGRAWESVHVNEAFDRLLHYGISHVFTMGDRLYISTTPTEGEIPTLWMSPDGTHWKPILGNEADTPQGLQNPHNIAIAALGEFRGRLYLGTFNHVDGGQVWAFQPPADLPATR